MRAGLVFAAVAAAAVAIASPVAAQIAIGVAGPMTQESLAPLAAEMRAGVELAVAAINARGGVLGQQLTVQVVDDNCAQERATAVANQLAGAGVVLVVGHLCSAASIAAAPVYAAEGIIQIAPGSPDPRFTEDRAGPGTFRLFGRTDDQPRVAAAFIAAHFAGRPVAVVDDRSRYAGNAAPAVRDAFATAGIEPVVNETYTVATADRPALVARLAAAGVAVVYFSGTAEEAARLRLEMTAQNLAAVLVTGDVAADPVFATTADAAADGTLFTFDPDLTRIPEAAGAIAALAGRGIGPLGVALYAWAAVEVWAEAAEAAGTVAFAPVAQNIASGLFDTVLGTLSFNALGEVNLGGWEVYEWRGDGYVPATLP